MPPENLDRTVAGARRGDEAAIADLYRALNPRLLRYLRHHAGPVAEDLASEVWLAIAPQLPDFDGGTSDLRILMFTIARRRVVDHYRQKGRHEPALSFDDTFDCADTSDTEALALAQVTAQSAVDALVRRLPADQAEIVLLRVLGDLEVSEVAALVGKSNAAVRVAQHRALLRLQRTWQRKDVTP